MKKTSILSSAVVLLCVAGADHAKANNHDERLLSYRNAQMYYGQMFAGNENEPFTGLVSGFPVFILPYTPINNLVLQAAVEGDDSTQRVMIMAIAASSQGGGYSRCDGGFRDGFPHGRTVCYRISDSLPIFEVHYNEGALNGPAVVYSFKNTDAHVLHEANFVNNQLDGPFVIYGRESSKPVATGVWSNSAIDGLYRRYADNQQNNLIQEQRYEFGELEGEERRYDADTGDLTSSAYNHQWGVIENPNNIDLEACALSWVDFYNDQSEEPLLFHYDRLIELKSLCAEGETPDA